MMLASTQAFAASFSDPQPAGEGPQEEHRKRKHPKHEGCILDLETRHLERRVQRTATVPTEMACLDVFRRPKPPECRHCEVDAPSGAQRCVNLAEKGHILLNVLDHIKKADCGQRLWMESCALERRLDHRSQTAPKAIACSIRSWLDQEGLEASLLKRQRDEPVPATDIDDRTRRRVPPDDRCHTGIPVLKPLRACF